jgi:uroporphyrin-III C-methyltransferase
MTGTVYLVGAGPGAADLLTLRAARLLRRANVLFHDALVSQEVLSLAAKAIKIEIGKRSGRLSTAQHFINKRLVDAARKHKLVVRLKGGDPMLFGRAHEEIEFLKRHGIRCEVVPGVTAALAAAAELKVSLTRRGLSRSIAFLTTRAAPGERRNDWIKTAVAADTVAIYMGAGEAESIARELIAAGKPRAAPVAVIENASLPEARVRSGTLESLPEIARLGGPSLILLGEVFSDAAIIRAWQAAQSSFSPTARATPSGRARSGSSR